MSTTNVAFKRLALGSVYRYVYARIGLLLSSPNITEF